MQLKTYLLLAAISCAFGLAHSQPLSTLISTKKLRAHVEFLSSDMLAGRLSGSTGEKLAAQYTANVFQHLGLEPAGDKGTFFQDFTFTAGVRLGKHNSVTITRQHGATRYLTLNHDWRPLAFSDHQSLVHAGLVFASYGITAPASGNLPAYDSYQGLNVKNKWVLVFRYLPEKINDELHHHLARYASLRYKAFTAREHGAKGIIFVCGPNVKVKHELVPLSFDTSLANTGIIAISVTNSVAKKLLANQFSGAPSISAHIDIQQQLRHGRNVLARLKTASATAPTIVIGAHADHLGQGEISGSRMRANESDHVHHGADDNASGVAGVLEAAAQLHALQVQGKLRGNKNILFALWSGEELGLLGSAHFIKSYTARTGNLTLRPAVDAYINLDMIGRLRKNFIIQGIGSSPAWPTLIERINHKHALPLATQNDPYLPTDATSFYLHGVPTLNFFTGSHDEYHTPRDTLALLNLDGMRVISQFLVDLVLALENESNIIGYRKVEKTGAHIGGGFRVYLGTIPDYASADISGVKLSGVTKDSPADRAGLRQDDVIIALAGKKIHDIYNYTFVLNELRIGTPVEVIAQRGGKQIRLEIIAMPRE